MTRPAYSWTGYPIAYRFNDGFRCAPCADRDPREPIRADVADQPGRRCADCGRALLDAETFSRKKHRVPH